MNNNNVKIEAVINGRPAFEVKAFLEKYADLCFFVKENDRFFDAVFSTPESTERFLNALKWAVLYITQEKKYYLRESKAEKKEEKEPDEKPNSEPEEKEIYKTDILLLDLPMRGFNCLRRAGLNTLGDIMNTPKSELLKIRNLGQDTLEKIISCVSVYIAEHGDGSEPLKEDEED